MSYMLPHVMGDVISGIGIAVANSIEYQVLGACMVSV